MGKKSASPKTYTLKFRITEEEYEKIMKDMNTANYLNTSKYLRDRVLGRRIRMERVKVTDAYIRAAINDISVKITKIGTNYNQVVRALNTAVNAKDKNGNPRINTKVLTMYVQQLNTLTVDIKREHEKLIEYVEKNNQEQE